MYAPTTDQVEVNRVTDPYSVALTLNSTHSVLVDLADKAFRPREWEKAKQPVVRPVDQTIYELHVRDFSINDMKVPAAKRGTYLAFATNGNGRAHLRELEKAGLTTVHLLPTFDIASIQEDRALQETPDCDLASYAPDSDQQQACVTAVADADGFNWGYDPLHWTTPEGSYAVDADGGARVAEFRTMVGALHADGLQVVLDQVFNHTTASGQSPQSVLDRVVPGYYQRLNATGNVETSTCCQNIATEHAMAQKAMVDSVVTWARDYKVDGFRFDLMGHHSVENMEAVRTALDKLTPKKDGVDGSKVYLYGEGWNFGEVANNALFTQATQGQLGGTGIGTFSDRLRDAVRGGGPFDENPRIQGFGSGGGTDPNGDAINGSTADQLARAAHDADLVRLGMAGNLRDYAFLTSAGTVQKGDGDRLQRPAGRVRRLPGGGHHLRRRPRQRDAVGLAHVQAADGHPDGGPRAHEHRLAGDDGPGPDAVVLARGRRPAAQQVARPQQLQLGRLVQPARPVRPGQRLRPRSAPGGRQRGQVAVPAAAAGRPGAEADPGGHRHGVEGRGRPAEAAVLDAAVPARLGRPDRAEGRLPGLGSRRRSRAWSS